MNWIPKIKTQLSEASDLKLRLLNDQFILNQVSQIVDLLIHAFKAGNKVLICGNGGSAADAQHLATEFSGRFLLDRSPLNAEALHVNTSFLTAVGNDLSFDQIFSRGVKAKGKPEDVLLALSTSGHSVNVINALKQAKSMGLNTIGFTGNAGDSMTEYCDVLMRIPSTSTPRIQECHLLMGHIICQLVEQDLFGDV